MLIDGTSGTVATTAMLPSPTKSKTFNLTILQSITKHDPHLLSLSKSEILNGTVYIGPHRTYHRSRVTGTRMANWARTLNKNYQTRKLAFRLNYIFYFIEEMSEKRKRMFTRKVFIRLVTLKSRISY